MIEKLRRARADLAIMNQLLPRAEQIARTEGIEQPAAEHLLLAALELDDGIAAAVLARHQIDAGALRAAIAAQHQSALGAIGVVADDRALDEALPIAGDARGPLRAQASFQTAFQRAAQIAKSHSVAMHSGHLLRAVTEAEHGTVARALAELGVDGAQLGRELDQFSSEEHPG